MMRKLDQRGVAAFEFVIVGALFFVLVYAIFDLGRYAITVQSLRALANADARAMMIQCYAPAEASKASPAGCTGSYLSTAQMQAVAPFLYAGGLTPSLSITSGAAALTVKASQPNFKMLVPIWGKALNAPIAVTEVPF